MLTFAPLLLLFATIFGGCGDDFAEYSVVDGFRLLAIGADRPELDPGQQTKLSALVTTEHAEQAVGTDVAYRWSWCPYTTGAANGFRCAVSETELQQALGAMGSEAPPISYDLGRRRTATLTHVIAPDAMRAACAALRAREIPAFTEPPDCETRFKITIRLEVRDDNGNEITGIKSVFLLYEQPSDRKINTNPQLVALRIGRAGADDLRTMGDTALTVRRETDYQLEASVADGASQRYQQTPPDRSAPQERSESLTFSWFIEAGELEDNRTGFIADEVSLQEAQTNVWTTPNSVHHPAAEARLYLVLRDNRGGISWLARDVRFED